MNESNQPKLKWERTRDGVWRATCGDDSADGVALYIWQAWRFGKIRVGGLLSAPICLPESNDVVDWMVHMERAAVIIRDRMFGRL